jgi:hypothetical protein
MWSPIISTLTWDGRDAVLVDPPLTMTQAAGIGDLDRRLGMRTSTDLRHPRARDHWFGAIPLLQKVPGVTVRATEGTAELMEVQNDPKFRAEFWDQVFPGQLPAGDVDVTVVDEHVSSNAAGARNEPPRRR